MNKALKTELDKALQDVGNAALPLADDRVHELIGELEKLRDRIVAWGLGHPRR